ncbi:TPA: hypothetical protein ACGIK9_002923 [Acinetobacter baumannii]|uniref:hypothetical protein n=1 Tax=Acinetobacter baumannii TaxID=470 RepID=UPI00338E6A74
MENNPENQKPHRSDDQLNTLGFGDGFQFTGFESSSEAEEIAISTVLNPTITMDDDQTIIEDIPQENNDVRSVSSVPIDSNSDSGPDLTFEGFDESYFYQNNDQDNQDLDNIFGSTNMAEDNNNSVFDGRTVDLNSYTPDYLLHPSRTKEEIAEAMSELAQAPESAVKAHFSKSWLKSQISDLNKLITNNAINDFAESMSAFNEGKSPNESLIPTLSGVWYKTNKSRDSALKGLKENSFEFVPVVSFNTVNPKTYAIEHADRYALKATNPNEPDVQTFLNSRSQKVAEQANKIDKSNTDKSNQLEERLSNAEADGIYVGIEKKGLPQKSALNIVQSPNIAGRAEELKLGEQNEIDVAADGLSYKETPKSIYGIRSTDIENPVPFQELEDAENALKRDFAQGMELGTPIIQPTLDETPPDADNQISDDIEKSQDKTASVTPKEDEVEDKLDSKDESKNDHDAVSKDSKKDEKPGNGRNSFKSRNQKPKSSSELEQPLPRRNKSQDLTDDLEALGNDLPRRPTVQGTDSKEVIKQLADLVLKALKLLLLALKKLLQVLFNGGRYAYYATKSVLDRRAGRDSFANDMKRDSAKASFINSLDFDKFFNKAKNTNGFYGVAGMPNGLGDKDPEESMLNKLKLILGGKPEYDTLKNKLDQNKLTPLTPANAEQLSNLENTNGIDTLIQTKDGAKFLIVGSVDPVGDIGKQFEIVEVKDSTVLPLERSSAEFQNSSLKDAKELMDEIELIAPASKALSIDLLKNLNTDFIQRPDQFFASYPNEKSLAIPTPENVIRDRVGTMLMDKKTGNPHVIIGVQTELLRNGANSYTYKTVEMNPNTPANLNNLSGLPVETRKPDTFSSSVNIRDNVIDPSIKDRLIDLNLNGINIEKNGISIDISDLQSLGQTFVELSKRGIAYLSKSEQAQIDKKLNALAETHRNLNAPQSETKIDAETIQDKLNESQQSYLKNFLSGMNIDLSDSHVQYKVNLKLNGDDSSRLDNSSSSNVIPFTRFKEPEFNNPNFIMLPDDHEFIPANSNDLNENKSVNDFKLLIHPTAKHLWSVASPEETIRAENHFKDVSAENKERHDQLWNQVPSLEETIQNQERFEAIEKANQQRHDDLWNKVPSLEETLQHQERFEAIEQANQKRHDELWNQVPSLEETIQNQERFEAIEKANQQRQDKLWNQVPSLEETLNNEEKFNQINQENNIRRSTKEIDGKNQFFDPASYEATLEEEARFQRLNENSATQFSYEVSDLHHGFANDQVSAIQFDFSDMENTNEAAIDEPIYTTPVVNNTDLTFDLDTFTPPENSNDLNDQELDAKISNAITEMNKNMGQIKDDVIKDVISLKSNNEMNVAFDQNLVESNIQKLMQTGTDSIITGEQAIKTPKLNLEDLLTSEPLTVSDITKLAFSQSPSMDDSGKTFAEQMQLKAFNTFVARYPETANLNQSEVNAIQEHVKLSDSVALSRVLRDEENNPDYPNTALFALGVNQPDDHLMSRRNRHDSLENLERRIKYELESNKFSPESVALCQSLVEKRITDEISKLGRACEAIGFDNLQTLRSEGIEKNVKDALTSQFGPSLLKINDLVMDSNSGDSLTVVGRRLENQEERILVAKATALGVLGKVKALDPTQLSLVSSGGGKLSDRQCENFIQFNASDDKGLSIEVNPSETKLNTNSNSKISEASQKIISMITNPSIHSDDTLACEMQDMRDLLNKTRDSFFKLQKDILEHPKVSSFVDNLNTAFNAQSSVIFNQVPIQNEQESQVKYEPVLNFDNLNLIRDMSHEDKAQELRNVSDFSHVLFEANDPMLNKMVADAGRLTRDMVQTVNAIDEIRNEMVSTAFSEADYTRGHFSNDDLIALNEQITKDTISTRESLPTILSSVAQYSEVANYLEERRSGSMPISADQLISNGKSKFDNFKDKISNIFNQSDLEQKQTISNKATELNEPKVGNILNESKQNLKDQNKNPDQNQDNDYRPGF